MVFSGTILVRTVGVAPQFGVFLYAIDSISGIHIAASRPPFHCSPCPLHHDHLHDIL